MVIPNNTTLPQFGYTSNSGITSSNPFVEYYSLRNPTTYDINYPIQKRWINFSTTPPSEWILEAFTNITGVTLATWKQLSGPGSGVVLGFDVPFGVSPVIPDVNGIITETSVGGSIEITGSLNTINYDLPGGFPAVQQLETDDGLFETPTGTPGTIIIHGTNGISTSQGTPHQVNINAQITSAQATSSITHVGVGSFNSSEFTVDGNGYVSLASDIGSITISGDTGGPYTGDNFTFTSVAQNITGGFSGGGPTLTLGFTDGALNFFLGNLAGKSGYTGTENTGIGYGSLGSITSGSINTFFGAGSGGHLTSGSYNTGIGDRCYNATDVLTGSYNSFLGSHTGLLYTSSESSNICIGYNTQGVTGESNVLRIGPATGTGTGEINTAVICGISGSTSASGSAVFVNSSNILGTTTSSIRFKENVSDIGNRSSRILDLRPVTFNYKVNKPHVSEEDSQILQYGLIAEEVEAVMLEMVIYSKEGKVESLRYQHLVPMLLNELQKAVKRIQILEEKL